MISAARAISSLKKLLFITAAFFCALIAPTTVLANDFGDTYVTASIADARTLIPLLASDSASADICGMIFNGLVKYDKFVNLTGDLARGWEVEDNGLSIIFHLKENVRWHDGVPFTAHDVDFTYRTIIDPNVKTPYSGDFERVKSLEIIDPLTVKVTYKEPFSPGLASWGMAMLPKHLLEGKDIGASGFARHPIGTGPYVFRRWKTQERIELNSYHEYFEKRPFIDRYLSLVIPDESTAFLELQTQGIDSSGLTPLQFKRQTDTPQFSRNYKKFRTPGSTYVYIGYNLSHGLFKDVRVRKALNMAVDKEELIAMILLGLGTPATGPFIPDTWAFNPAVRSASFDPKAAGRLLDECGWKLNGKDPLRTKDGVRFEFTITTSQGNDERNKAAQIIQKRLQDIGIKVKIRVVEWSVFVNECINRKQFDAVLLGWSLPKDPDNFDIWHSSKTKEGEFNFIGYKNPEVDRLLIEARRTFDQHARAQYYYRIHEILYDEQPYMFLYVPDSLIAVHRRFRGIMPAPIGIGYNFIEWWVPELEQRYRLWHAIS